MGGVPMGTPKSFIFIRCSTRNNFVFTIQLLGYLHFRKPPYRLVKIPDSRIFAILVDQTFKLFAACQQVPAVCVTFSWRDEHDFDGDIMNSNNV